MRRNPLPRMTQNQAAAGRLHGLRLWKSHSSARALTSVVESLATLLEAGIPLRAALFHLQSGHLPDQQRRYVELATMGLERGEKLSDAWSFQVSGVFGALLLAGEQSGQLGQVLQSWVHHQSQKRTFRDQVTHLLSYPVLLIAITCALLMFISEAVFPAFADMYQQLGMPQSSSIVSFKWWLEVIPWFILAVVTVFGAAVLLFLVMEKRIPQWWTWIRRDIPGLRLLRLWRTSFFCELLEMLLSAGIPIADALHQLSGFPKPIWLRERCGVMERSILNGNSLQEALHGGWDPLLDGMLVWAEQTGELQSACARVHRSAQRMMVLRMERLAKIVQPMLLVFLGALVGFAMYVLFVPMYDLTTVMSSGQVH